MTVLLPSSLRSHSIIIRGAGELATSIAHRLAKVSFTVLCLEVERPLCVRTTISFASTILSSSGSCTVEGITAQKASNINDVFTIWEQKKVAVLNAPHLSPELLSSIKPLAIVDAMMTKTNSNGTHLSLAPLTIGLGPGFTAGEDVHFVIETCRGHDLGRINSKGKAIANTGIPGEIGSKTHERLLRACCDGVVTPLKIHWRFC
ncbi:hypothetical protein GEMRC1_007103 [Eukaryota sp. GEM-RC1]